MNGSYLGHLAVDDPLHGFLDGILRDRLGVHRPSPDFRVYRLTGSNEVYAYRERASGIRVICKFFGARCGGDRGRAAHFAYREYESLQRLRRYDLVGSPHHVIRPLGVEPDINCVLAVEYYEGEQFSEAIGGSVHRCADAHLFRRLTALAFYLATQHNRTANGEGVDFDTDCRYFDRVVSCLLAAARIGRPDADELRGLRDGWRQRPRMWSDRQVWLHGDATPANFLFGGGLDVGAIDLERMKRGDRMFDVGRIVGELQHAFMVTGDKTRAEPFIGHFLWEYSCHFPDRYSAFSSITSRAPYYMAVNLLRIARNDYVDEVYRGRLVAQAKELLRAC